MGFLFPGFLFGLAALAVPVVIHLIHRKRARLVDFPSLIFLKLLEKRIARRRRLEELIVLMLRCLALALLALGLASPVFKGAKGGRLGVARAIVIDDSLSMSLKTGTGAMVIDRAKAAAERLLACLGRGDTAAVIRLNRLDPAIEMSHRIERVISSLKRIEPTMGPTPLVEGIKLALECLDKATHSIKDLVVFTDLQAKAVKEIDAAGILEELPGDVRLFVTAPRTQAGSDLSLRSVTVRPIASRSNGHRIIVTVFNGSDLKTTSILSITVDGVAAGQREVTLDGGGVLECVFDLPNTGDSEKEGVAILSGDGLEGNNRRYFPVPKRTPLPVLIISDATTHIARLDPVFYIQRALEPGEASTIKTEVVNSTEAAGRDPNDYGAIILTDPSDLPAELVDVLDKYMIRGGGVLVFLGPGSQAGPLGGGEGLAGFKVGGTAGEKGSKGYKLTGLDRHHPVLTTLFTTSPPLDLGRPRIYRYRLLEALPPGCRILASLSTGKPFILEKRVGPGRLLLVTSTANPEWNDLAWRVSFVPLLHSMAHYLAERMNPGGTEWILERPVLISWPRRDGAPLEVEVQSPDGRTKAGTKQAGEGAEAGFKPFHKVGMARVAFLGRNGRKLRLIGLNVDPKESDLTRVEWGGRPGRFIPLDYPKKVEKEVQAGLEGISLADTLIALALLVLVAEGLLAWHALFKRRAA